MSPLLQQLMLAFGQGQSSGSAPMNLTTDAQGNFLQPSSSAIPASSFPQAAQQLSQSAGAPGSGASGSLTGGVAPSPSNPSGSSPLGMLLASIGTGHTGGSQQNVGGGFTL